MKLWVFRLRWQWRGGNEQQRRIRRGGSGHTARNAVDVVKHWLPVGRHVEHAAHERHELRLALQQPEWRLNNRIYSLILIQWEVLRAGKSNKAYSNLHSISNYNFMSSPCAAVGSRKKRSGMRFKRPSPTNSCASLGKSIKYSLVKM